MLICKPNFFLRFFYISNSKAPKPTGFCSEFGTFLNFGTSACKALFSLLPFPFIYKMIEILDTNLHYLFCMGFFNS